MSFNIYFHLKSELTAKKQDASRSVKRQLANERTQREIARACRKMYKRV
jgi:hypothetical protein